MPSFLLLFRRLLFTKAIVAKVAVVGDVDFAFWRFSSASVTNKNLAVFWAFFIWVLAPVFAFRAVAFYISSHVLILHSYIYF